MYAVIINGDYVKDVDTRKAVPYRTLEVAQLEIDYQCAEDFVKREDCRICDYPEAEKAA